MANSPPPVLTADGDERAEGPLPFLPTGPLSPATALAAIAAAPDVKATTKAIVFGLVSTISNQEQAWKTNKLMMQQHIDELYHKIRLLEDCDEDKAPDGFVANKGYVDIPILVDNDFLVPAK
jgi:hypothetical protein